MVDYPELLSWDRFRASEANMTFLPARFLGGSDIAARNPAIVPFDCPLTGRRLWAVPPADPDVVVVHALAADAYGNVLYPERRLLPQSLDITLSRSCDTVIVTAERIVSNAEVRRNAHLTEIASYRTTHVVEAPWGAHPCPVLGFSKIDDEAFRVHARAAVRCLTRSPPGSTTRCIRSTATGATSARSGSTACSRCRRRCRCDDGGAGDPTRAA